MAKRSIGAAEFTAGTPACAPGTKPGLNFVWFKYTGDFN